MPRKPKPPPPTRRDIYRVAKKSVWLGTVEVPDKQAAIEKGALEFKAKAWCRMRWRGDDAAQRPKQ
jgi:hypothetical protein